MRFTIFLSIIIKSLVKLLIPCHHCTASNHAIVDKCSTARKLIHPNRLAISTNIRIYQSILVNVDIYISPIMVGHQISESFREHTRMWKTHEKLFSTKMPNSKFMSYCRFTLVMMPIALIDDVSNVCSF